MLINELLIKKIECIHQMPFICSTNDFHVHIFSKWLLYVSMNVFIYQMTFICSTMIFIFSKWLFYVQRIIFAFACNAKRFAIACDLFFCAPSLPCFRNRLAKVFLLMFHVLPTKRVTKIDFISLDTLRNISLVICSLLLNTRVTHDVSCALEKNQ